LHEQLHRIAAPEGLGSAGHGERLIHLDLHPENVILSPEGPVVIDWTNAAWRARAGCRNDVGDPGDERSRIARAALPPPLPLPLRPERGARSSPWRRRA